ncbi:hypothetical protein GCM10023231_15460 [Olivibacter ginsenosidimutans]|uniref:Uncharacterized protein n=1 Tax=Olivibacter ginsenosidimutans TaxID=1176537 RepID=A0ABP9AZK1_9SPHI
METVLPFIIAALVFGFQVYSNFKKEQEKAKKRVQTPPKHKSIAKGPVSSPTQPVKEKHPVYVQTIDVKDEAEEVKRARKIHQAHAHAFKRLDPFMLDEQQEENADFDLRDAVIKSIILERPYK